MAEPIVALDGVAKSYGGRPALAGVSFEIRRGEAVGYLGPNGAGKSTTLKLLLGLLPPDRGRVRLFGEDPGAAGGAARRHVGALLEAPGVVPYLHGRDWLEYFAGAKGLEGAAAAAEVDRAAAALRLEHEIDRPMGGLSTGLLRRVMIASALVGAPDLLVLDEPTIGLDPVARQDLRALLSGLVRGGQTVLLSTHLLEDVEAICERVLFLREGRLVGDEPLGPPPGSGDEAVPRALRVEFLPPVDLSRLPGLLQAGERSELLSLTAVRVHFSGGDRRQAELLERFGRAGLRLLAAHREDPGLAERYLELVGREDAI